MNRPCQFVLKMHSRCDLACEHCYVYESTDQTWRGRPMVISDQVISRTVQPTVEHACGHRLSSVRVVLHGGEPLLADRVTLRQVETELPSALAECCEFFAEHDVRISISIDGEGGTNDRYRRCADGHSDCKVIRAIEPLSTDRSRELCGGLLRTIDLANRPVAIYRSLISLDPSQIDFLLSHAPWGGPPTRLAATDAECCAFTAWSRK